MEFLARLELEFRDPLIILIVPRGQLVWSCMEKFWYVNMNFSDIERARMHPASQPRARMNYACGFWMTVGSDHALYSCTRRVRMICETWQPPDKRCRACAWFQISVVPMLTAHGLHHAIRAVPTHDCHGSGLTEGRKLKQRKVSKCQNIDIEILFKNSITVCLIQWHGLWTEGLHNEAYANQAQA